MPDFAIKRNDRQPPFERTLPFAGTLTGASVKFTMTKQGATSPTVDSAATIVDATLRKVRYDWGPTDTVVAGEYDGEFEVTFPSGQKQTFPGDSYYQISIRPDLSGALALNPVPGVIDVKAYGAKGDGVADDTAAIQLALDQFGDPSNRSGRIVIPTGKYRITSALTYKGHNDHALFIQGTVAPHESDMTGSQLYWDGSTGGTMFRFLGAHSTTVADVTFDGNRKALRCISVEFDHARSMSSQHVRFERCALLKCVGTGSALVTLGEAPDPSTYSVENITFEKCFLQGHTSFECEYGVRALSGGNVGNFRIVDCFIKYLTVAGIEMPGNRVVGLERCIFGAVRGRCFRGGGGTLASIKDCCLENGTEAGEFWEWTGGGGSLHVFGGQWQTVAPASDDVVVSINGCDAIVEGSQLINDRVGGTSWPVVRVDGTAQAGAFPVSFRSHGSTYFRATDAVMWLRDTGGNDLLNIPPSFYVMNNDVAVESIDDKGAADGNTKLRHRLGTPRIVGSQSAVNPASGTGITQLYTGRPVRVCQAYRLDFGAWSVAALTKDIQLCTIRANERIVAVYAITSPSYGGVAGTLNLRVGIGVNGNGLLVDKDVKSAAVNQGAADADLGTSINRANAIQGAYAPWAQQDVWTRLTSSSGNLSGLNAGSTVFIIETEILPLLVP